MLHYVVWFSGSCKSTLKCVRSCFSYECADRCHQTYISSQLLRKLQQTKDDSSWDDDPGLLLWLLYVGGAFAPENIRIEYLELLRLNNATRFRDLYKTWPEQLEVLKQFVWSEKAFMSPAKAFWEETCA